MTSIQAISASALVISSLVFGTALAEPGTLPETKGAPDATSGQTGPRTKIDTVVVEARKVTESAQSVPIAITAATGESLRDLGFIELQDLSKLAPNLSIRHGGVTGSTFAAITLRGQSGTFHTLNADQAVGLYVNGAPYSRATGFFTTLFDIERVEVLKGPQGTLYGRNTTGGAINVYTKGPDYDGIGGYGEVTVGNYDRLDFQGALNLPLIEDKLAVRLAGAYTSRDGFGIGNVTGQELADDDEIFFRGALLFEPTDNLTIRINGDYHKADEAGPVFRSLRTVDIGTPMAPFPLAVESVGDIYTGNAFGIPHVDFLEEFNVNGTIELALEHMTLTSITAYREFESANSNQTNPVVAVTLLGQEASLFTQELRANGTLFDDRLTWQVGVFYSDESGTDSDIVAFFSNQITRAENESWAVFTQNSFAITDRLNFTAGARFSKETKFVRDPNQMPAENQESFTGWSWTFALDYQITDNILTYISASRGFRSGAIDQDLVTNIVRPEFVNTYEIGLKSDLLEDRLRINLAAFYSDYKDIQRTGFLENSILTGIRNAASATIKGFEAEITAVPIDGLTLSAAIAYLDAGYDEYIDGLLDRSDDAFSQPEWTVTLTARYETQIGNAGLLGFQASYYWQDDIDFGTVDNRPLLPVGQQFIDSYGLLNLQVDYTLDRWGGINLAFFARNVTDEEYFTAAFNGVVFGAAFANRFVGEPMTWGFRLRKDF